MKESKWDNATMRQCDNVFLINVLMDVSFV